MELNLPILTNLLNCHNVLVVGIGGGFDVLCGLPLFFELRQYGITVHLANYSFSDITHFRGGQRITETLVGVTADYTKPVVYFPELYLSQWFAYQRQEAVTVWAFHKTGVRPLVANYRVLITHLNVDAIVLIDGGVDSLIRGDETDAGTYVEDSVSLCAVRELDEVETRILACIGLGAERNLTYAHIFENIAALTKQGSFLGVCALTREMEAYQAYEAAMEYIHRQPYQDPSVINASIISAVRGEFGNYHLTEKTYGSTLWISPLMTLYWFFQFAPIAQQNLFLDALRDTETFQDAMRVGLLVRQTIKLRRGRSIPL